MASKLLASTTDLDEGEFQTATVDGTEIIVGKADGRFFAVEDVCPHAKVNIKDLCPHAYVTISYGWLEGCKLTCPWHGYSFDVHTGECLTGLETETLTVLSVEVRVEEVYLKDASGETH